MLAEHLIFKDIKKCKKKLIYFDVRVQYLGNYEVCNNENNVAETNQH